MRRIGEEVAPEAAVIGEFKIKILVKEICRHVGIARSTYYRWKKKSRTDISSQEQREKSTRCTGRISFDVAIVESLSY
ncbi:transposase [Domibacillus indicus]|uniref:transposase n=1 Tax=Domibacillus indicus TaxID=1437523 RepID=UPI0037BFD6DB